MAASPNCGGTGHMLPNERARASFDSQQLVRLIRGDKGDQIAHFRKLFDRSPFTEERDDYYLSYKDLFERRLERMTEAMNILRNNEEFATQHKALKVPMRTMFDSAHTMSLHFSMFLTYVRTQSSDEQLRKWLGPTLAGHFNGAYAQTELGHGSNVRGLETICTYDKSTDEFVVHSPTLTSMKWWPTAMYASTHAVVFGRLIIDDKDYGFHGFLVQLRDKFGFCMPGVEVGEIGPKMSGGHANIGYARFTHVRIPRFNMFAKNQQVTKDGEYIAAPKKLSKFKYISMMSVRSNLVEGAGRRLAQAVTIAIRYSCVRQQGFKDSQSDNAIASGEHTVMDYSMQQYRLFKALSLAYMFTWSGRFVGDYLSRVQKAVEAGDESAADEMPDLHATLAGLKAFGTVWAHENIEECRKTCGGQGHMLSSGIAEISRSYAEAVTVEGEQVILALQTARFLIKAAADANQQTTLAGSVSYLQQTTMPHLSLPSYRGRLDVLLALLRDRARRMAFKLESSFRAAQAKGKSFDEALNSVAVIAYKSAGCHSMYVMASQNWNALGEYVEDERIHAVLLRLLELLMLMEITDHAGDWMDQLSSENIDVMQGEIMELLTELRPDAVALVDGFGFNDFELNSALGRYDGNVYEAIYEEARRNPLNQTDKMVGWDNYIKHLNPKFIDMTAEGQRQGEFKSKL